VPPEWRPRCSLRSTARACCSSSARRSSAARLHFPAARRGYRTRHAAAGDSLENAAGYLDRAIGERAPRALRQALLEQGPRAIESLESSSDVAFRAYPRHPDYLSAIEGSTVAGRALEPLPFDGRTLGRLFALVRPPIPEFTVLGGMMVDRTDINHLLGMGRSFRSLRHSAKILLRHVTDRLRYPRGTRLVMGNALVARLLHSLAQRGNVTLLTSTDVAALTAMTGASIRSRWRRAAGAVRFGLATPSCSQAAASTGTRRDVPTCCRVPIPRGARARPGIRAPRTTWRLHSALATANAACRMRSGRRCRCAAARMAATRCFPTS
jgi:hypothetical protein